MVPDDRLYVRNMPPSLWVRARAECPAKAPALCRTYIRANLQRTVAQYSSSTSTLHRRYFFASTQQEQTCRIALPGASCSLSCAQYTRAKPEDLLGGPPASAAFFAALQQQGMASLCILRDPNGGGAAPFGH